MTRTGLRTTAICATVLLGVSCSAISVPATSERLPFRVREIQPDPFSKELVELLNKCLEKTFVEVVEAEEEADLKVKVKKEGEDFGAGEVDPGGAALSTFLWLAVGHLSWFIEDVVYPSSNVTISMTISTMKSGEEDDSRVVYYRLKPVPKDLRLSNSERTNFGSSLLNIFVPPAFVTCDSRREYENLTRELVKRFALEEPGDIVYTLPQEHLRTLSCFLVHDGDTAILVSEIRVTEFQIEGDVLTRNVVEGFRLKDPDDRDSISDRLSELRPGLVVPGQPVLFYEFPLDGHRGFIQVRVTLEGGRRARWTILHDLADASGTS